MFAKRLAVLAVVALSGCGAELQDAADARVEALQATKAGAEVVEVAHLVGILPSYTCGAPAQVEFADLVPAVKGNLGSCAAYAPGPTTETSESLVVSFPAQGCDVIGAIWTGDVTATVSGGQDRSEVVLDLRGAAVNGHPVDARIGRLSCGDEDTWSIDASARVPATAHLREMDLAFHGTVVDRPGIPFLGADYLIIDGPLQLEYGGRTVQAVFHQVWWEPGLSVPRKGTVDLVDPDGRQLSLRFDHGDLGVSVNGGKFAPVPVP